MCPFSDSNATDDDDHTLIRGLSKVDSSNSSTSTLGIAGVFTGTFVDVLRFAMVSINVYSDVASATGGLEIQWSTDGTNIGDIDTFTIAAGSNKQFTFGTAYQYYRIKYTNGGTGQTAFRLQSILNPFIRKASSHRIQDSITNEDDAELMKSVLTGKAPSGAFRNVNTDESGNLAIALAPGATVIPTLGTNFSHDDMNASTGGIARSTVVTNDVWTQVYSYSGSGLLFGIRVSLENLVSAGKNWWIRLVVDSVEVFGSNGFDMVDLGTITLYGWSDSVTTLAQTWVGINLVGNTFLWSAPEGLPITYSSSVTVYVKHTGDNRKFYAGLVALTKD